MFKVQRKQRGETNTQEWLNTYADMITLVLTFFVLLYSISNVNIEKLEKVAAAMQKELGIEGQIDFDEVSNDVKFPVMAEGTEITTPSQMALDDAQQNIQNYMEENNVNAEISAEDNVLYIRFKNEVLFAPDSPSIIPESVGLLDYIGDVIKTKESEILAVYINGHTADGANSVWNDRMLSSQRADNVAIYLEENKGIDPKKLISRGYGKNYPIADNSTPEGRDQNRRVDIIILGNDFEWTQIAGDGSGSVEQFEPITPIDVPGVSGQ